MILLSYGMGELARQGETLPALVALTFHVISLGYNEPQTAGERGPRYIQVYFNTLKILLLKTHLKVLYIHFPVNILS